MVTKSLIGLQLVRDLLLVSTQVKHINKHKTIYISFIMGHEKLDQICCHTFWMNSNFYFVIKYTVNEILFLATAFIENFG